MNNDRKYDDFGGDEVPLDQDSIGIFASAMQFDSVAMQMPERYLAAQSSANEFRRFLKHVYPTEDYNVKLTQSKFFGGQNALVDMVLPIPKSPINGEVIRRFLQTMPPHSSVFLMPYIKGGITTVLQYNGVFVVVSKPELGDQWENDLTPDEHAALVNKVLSIWERLNPMLEYRHIVPVQTYDFLQCVGFAHLYGVFRSGSPDPEDLAVFDMNIADGFISFTVDDYEFHLHSKHIPSLIELEPESFRVGFQLTPNSDGEENGRLVTTISIPYNK